MKTLGFDQNYLNKLTIDDKPGTVRDLCIVTGDITGKKTGIHAEYGPWVKFIGNFAATDKDGVINRSGELLLPNVISPIVDAQFQAATNPEKGAKFDEKTRFEYLSIEFEINVERTERSYKYGCKNLNEQSAQEDPMAQRLAGLVEKNKKLTAGSKN